MSCLEKRRHDEIIILILIAYMHRSFSLTLSLFGFLVITFLVSPAVWHKILERGNANSAEDRCVLFEYFPCQMKKKKGKFISSNFFFFSLSLSFSSIIDFNET